MKRGQEGCGCLGVYNSLVCLTHINIHKQTHTHKEHVLSLFELFILVQVAQKMTKVSFYQEHHHQIPGCNLTLYSGPFPGWEAFFFFSFFLAGWGGRLLWVSSIVTLLQDGRKERRFC